MLDPEMKNSIRKPKLRKAELFLVPEAKHQSTEEILIPEQIVVAEPNEQTEPNEQNEQNEQTVQAEQIGQAEDVEQSEQTEKKVQAEVAERQILRPKRIAVKTDRNEKEDLEKSESEKDLKAEIESESENTDIFVESSESESEAQSGAETDPELEGAATFSETFTQTEPQPQLRRIIDLTQAKSEVKVEQPEPEVKKTYLVPDIPLRFSTFEEALDSCREIHPSPEELLMNQTAVQRTWLMSQLKKAKTESEIETLAYSLDFKDLSVLFPVLSTVKKRDEANQIQNLIRLRASHFLYICGWLTLQFSYPRSTVARVLADLCMILEDISFLREELSQGEMEQIRECKTPDLGPDRIIWNEVEMISEISLPNSRRFVSDIANELYKSSIDEDVFLKRYAIYPNLALGKTILEKYEEIATGMEVNPMLSNAFLDRFKRDN